MTKTRIAVWGTLAVALLSITFATHAVVNAPVNIVYPISLQSYENYFEVSFSTTCPGGQWTAEWFLDGTLLGQGTYYDQLSAQFSHKATSGWHVFQVDTSCGSDAVRFFVL
ncbi:MAG: hypothetical protein AAGN66_26610 [Acidobacteriota bacterium]